MREAVSECGYLLTVRHARKEKDGVCLFFLRSESERVTLFLLRGRVSLILYKSYQTGWWCCSGVGLTTIRFRCGR